MKDLKFGFTLSEVLITLGVVGVVAAMTMPTLIRNYQKMTWTNQLKKSYSTLAQAIEKMKADEGVTSLAQTELASVTNSNNQVFKLLSKYIKTMGIKKLSNYKYTYLNYNSVIDQSNSYGLFFADGTVLTTFIIDSTSDGALQANQIMIDVNGIKGPNIVGRDIFGFSIYYDKLYAKGDKTLSNLIYRNTHSGNTNDRNWENGSYNYSCRLDKSSKGLGCAARILEKGKMDY